MDQDTGGKCNEHFFLWTACKDPFNAWFLYLDWSWINTKLDAFLPLISFSFLNHLMSAAGLLPEVTHVRVMCSPSKAGLVKPLISGFSGTPAEKDSERNTHAEKSKSNLWRKVKWCAQKWITGSHCLYSLRAVKKLPEGYDILGKSPQTKCIKEANSKTAKVKHEHILNILSTITCLNPPVLPGALSSTEVNLNLDLLFIVGIWSYCNSISE